MKSTLVSLFLLIILAAPAACCVQAISAIFFPDPAAISNWELCPSGRFTPLTSGSSMHSAQRFSATGLFARPAKNWRVRRHSRIETHHNPVAPGGRKYSLGFAARTLTPVPTHKFSSTSFR